MGNYLQKCKPKKRPNPKLYQTRMDQHGFESVQTELYLLDPIEELEEYFSATSELADSTYMPPPLILEDAIIYPNGDFSEG